MTRHGPIKNPPLPHGRWISPECLAAFEAAGTNAHRLYSSEDVWVERFGRDLLISYKHQGALELVLRELPEWSHLLQWDRVFGKHLPRQNEERAAPVLLEGDPSLPLETVVIENGMRFGLDFAAGYSAGLFIDQRANRAFLRQLGVKRFLNTFSYTCSFSVAAALGPGGAGGGGWALTTSVDLSKKSIDRGRENFRLNGLDPEVGHAFYADDVLEVLPRLARKGQRFEAIVLDPPTFSRGNKGRKFQVEQDFEDLLRLALEVAAPKARLLLSTNCTRMNRQTLETIGRYCLKGNRLAGSFHTEPGLPDLPMGFAAQTLWLTLK